MPLFAEFDPSILFFIAAVAIITWMLLMRSHRYFGRQRASEPENKWESKPTPKPPAVQGELPATVARWEVEMHETARQMSAQLDGKMSALQALIADADRAAARLEAALDGESAPAAPPSDNQTESLKLPSEGRREEIHTLSDYGFTAAEIARRIDAPVDEVEAILRVRGKK
jgi:hypothetical protein